MLNALESLQTRSKQCAISFSFVQRECNSHSLSYQESKSSSLTICQSSPRTTFHSLLEYPKIFVDSYKNLVESVQTSFNLSEERGKEVFESQFTSSEEVSDFTESDNGTQWEVSRFNSCVNKRRFGL